MTSLICWAGRDTHAPLASLYIATDSRITWGAPAWDLGRKTFAAARSPDIFGYCGDVVFASLVLSQFVSALDEGLYPVDFAQRSEGLERLLRVSLRAVPEQTRHPFSVVHGGRDEELMKSRFHARLIGWHKDTGWDVRDLPIPTMRSGVVHLDGSGAPVVQSEINRWQRGAAAGTTRGLFGAFVDAVESGKDPATGGAPQLVGLFRRGMGQSFGVLFKQKRFLYGMPVRDLAPDSALAWRNDLFEVASGVTRRRLPDSASHSGSAPGARAATA